MVMHSLHDSIRRNCVRFEQWGFSFAHRDWNQNSSEFDALMGILRILLQQRFVYLPISYAIHQVYALNRIE